MSPSAQNVNATCGKDSQHTLTVPTKKLEINDSPACAMYSRWSLQDSNLSTTPTGTPTTYDNSATGETAIGHTVSHKLVVDVDLVADRLAADGFDPDQVRRIISALRNVLL